MAFVDDCHELVFIHIPKTGGTSISTALIEAHGLEQKCKRDLAHEGVGGAVPKQFKPNGITVHDRHCEIVEKYPQAKDYSSFCIVRNPWARIYSFWQHKVRRGDKDIDTEASFSECFRHNNVLLLQPQIWWMGEDTDVIKFEEMGEHLPVYLSEKGLDITLPHLNKTKEKKDYHSEYDEYSYSLIRDYYWREIDLFDYQF